MNSIALIRESISLPLDYSVPASTEEYRNEVVLKAQEITAISSSSDNIQASIVAVEIRKHIKDVEGLRVELTKPLLDAQRKLKALSDDHVGPLRIELSRIESLATSWQLRENERVKALEAARMAEVQRLEQERIQAEKASLEAAKAQGNPLYDSEDAYEAQKQAERIAEQQRGILTAPKPEPVKARGQTVKTVLRWECTDAIALWNARPDLCNPPTAKASAIQATCDPSRSIPGLKLWHEAKATFTTR